MFLHAFATDTHSQLNVLGHDGDALAVNGTQIGVRKKVGQVGFRGLLQSHNGRRLETQVRLKVRGDFSHQTLEWQLSNQEFRALLIATNLAQGDGAGAIAVGFLDAALRLRLGLYRLSLLLGSLSSRAMRRCFNSCHVKSIFFFKVFKEYFFFAVRADSRARYADRWKIMIIS